MNHQHSETAAPGATNHGDDKGKQREEPIRTSTPDELSSPAELHSDANLALWTSMFRRKKDCKKTPSRSFQEVVEVCAKRVPKASLSPFCPCLALTRYGHIRDMLSSSKKNQWLGCSIHLRKVLPCTHRHFREDKQGHHHNLSLDMFSR